MKIAICFYGLHPDETWKTKTKKKDKCFDLWSKNVFDINNCDIFIHSFSKKKDELSKYKPKDYLFENKEIFKKNNNIQNSDTNIKYYGEGRMGILKIMGYGIKKTVELMGNYEEKHNFKYDLVLVSRIDVFWLKPIFLNKLNTSYFYSAVWGINNFHGKRTNGFLAYWFISNTENIKKLSLLYDNIDNYIHKSQCWHIITKAYIDTFLTKNDIIYRFNDISHDENCVDMDLQRNF